MVDPGPSSSFVLSEGTGSTPVDLPKATLLLRAGLGQVALISHRNRVVRC